MTHSTCDTRSGVPDTTRHEATTTEACWAKAWSCSAAVSILQAPGQHHFRILRLSLETAGIQLDTVIACLLLLLRPVSCPVRCPVLQSLRCDAGNNCDVRKLQRSETPIAWI